MVTCFLLGFLLGLSGAGRVPPSHHHHLGLNRSRNVRFATLVGARPAPVGSVPCLKSRCPRSRCPTARSPARRTRQSPWTCGTASPVWRTAGRASTDRRAPRSSTPRSTPPPTGSAAATTPTATARLPPPRRATRSPSEPRPRWASCSVPTRPDSSSGRRPPTTCSRSRGRSAATCVRATRSCARVSITIRTSRRGC